MPWSVWQRPAAGPQSLEHVALFCVQAMLLGLVYLVDRAWAKKGLLPPWYIKMRLPLTTLAAAGLLLTATAG